MTANQRLFEIDIKIINDDEWEPDEAFFVRLSLCGNNNIAKVGQISICMITIINDDGSENLQKNVVNII